VLKHQVSGLGRTVVLMVKKICLGTYSTELEAHEVHMKWRKSRLIELAEKYKEHEKLSAALLEHANKI
jgi:hypothetical protein